MAADYSATQGADDIHMYSECIFFEIFSTLICMSLKFTSKGPHDRKEAIIWNNGDILIQPLGTTSVNFEWKKVQTFHSIKCILESCLQNVGHFVLASSSFYYSCYILLLLLFRILVKLRQLIFGHFSFPEARQRHPHLASSVPGPRYLHNPRLVNRIITAQYRPSHQELTKSWHGPAWYSRCRYASRDCTL